MKNAVSTAVSLALIWSIGQPRFAPHMRAQDSSKPIRAEYRFTVGGTPIRQGTLWVYYSAYQWFERYRLADVVSGRADIVVSTEFLRQHDPAPGDSTVLIALEVPNVGWYGPTEVTIVENVVRLIDGLGTATVAEGVHRVELSPSVPQVLRLQNLNGTPRPNQSVTVWVFETETGHCAVPVGIGGTSLVSDARGAVRFRAPLRDMYLTATYFDPQTGEEQRGESLSAAREHVIRKQWDKKRTVKTLEFHVTGADGRPANAQIFVEEPWNFADCSNPTRLLGTTNAAGLLRVTLAWEDVAAIWIGQDAYDDHVYLQPDALAELRRTGVISFTWP